VMIDDDWLGTWHTADAAARAAIDALVESWDEPFEGRVARDAFGIVPAGSSFVVASSMPVRDLESFARPRDDVVVHANRGVNGIDGFVSTVLGVAASAGAAAAGNASSGNEGPTVALVGDLCFLHDVNGLLGAEHRGLDATFVVVDNGGGGIFSFLPQAELPDHFETLFGTRQDVDLAAVARLHGLEVDEVRSAGALAPAVEASIATGGVRVVLVRTDRSVNVQRHRDVWSAVADSLSR
jgi:2-succinyl-5-enolpyruvyl-6-hydroxy-3-cyclohexene-1-carboxylate synthase